MRKHEQKINGIICVCSTFTMIKHFYINVYQFTLNFIECSDCILRDTIFSCFMLDDDDDDVYLHITHTHLWISECPRDISTWYSKILCVHILHKCLFFLSLYNFTIASMHRTYTFLAGSFCNAIKTVLLLTFNISFAKGCTATHVSVCGWAYVCTTIFISSFNS